MTLLTKWIMSLIQTIPHHNLPPTIATRFIFLAINIIYDSYRCVNNLRPFNTRYPPLDMFNEVSYNILPQNYENWVDRCSYEGLKILYQHLGYNISILPISTVTVNEDVLNQWKQRINNYIEIRDKDGWRDSFEFKGILPNDGHFITPEQIQDLKSLPYPNKWCSIDGQTYLTPEWGSVKGVLDEESKNKLLDIARKFYKDDIKEVEEVKNISQTLTTKEKAIAEFWENGMNTITPPGVWMFFAVQGAQHHQMSLYNELKLYLRMTSGLFEASILAWSLKREYMQARPIQTIRQLPQNELWKPYQQENFLTPPFPDFVSGHSTFSGVGSRILQQTFDNNYIKFDGELLKLISPMFETNHDIETSTTLLTLYPNTSSIQTPNNGCCLMYSSWDEMAEDAGMSRLYGGIHYQSSNLGGLALGRNLSSYV
jgi:hypothetical protein